MALWATTQILPGLTYEGGAKTIILASGALMVINMAVIPLLKVMFLPLNLLTLGVFTWALNVLGIYLMTRFIPQIELRPFTFPGLDLTLLIVPPVELNILQVAIAASFLVGFMSHFLNWLMEK